MIFHVASNKISLGIGCLLGLVSSAFALSLMFFFFFNRVYSRYYFSVVFLLNFVLYYVGNGIFNLLNKRFYFSLVLLFII